MHQASLAPLFAFFAYTTLAAAQQLRQPTAGQLYTSFSGYGQVPFEYVSSSSAITAIDISAVAAGPNGRNDTYIIAEGLQFTSGNTINTVFAPIGGWCGDVTLQVTEISGNASTLTVSRDITINCGAVQLAIPAPDRLQKRQDSGPSGTLNAPAGGQTYSESDSLNLQYTPVTEGGQTFGIDASLTGDAGNFTLVNGLFKPNSTSTITARFSLPAGACGTFQLAITEHQLYQSSAIQFQAAAPSLTISCSPAATNGTNSTAPTHANATATVVPVATMTGSNGTTTLFNTTMTSRSTATNTSSIIPSSAVSAVVTSTSVLSTGTTAANSIASSIPVVIPLSTPSTSLSTTSISSATSTSSSAASSSSTSTSTSTTSSTTYPSAVAPVPSTVVSITTSSVVPTSTVESTVTSTMSTSSGGAAPIIVTSVVTTTASTSSGVSSGSTTTTSSHNTSIVATSTASRPANATAVGPVPVSTITVTQLPTGDQGVTTITAQPAFASVDTSGLSSLSKPSSITSTYTTTNIVVVAAPQQSSSTSTRTQTVILITQSIAAIVEPSSTSVPTTSSKSGALASLDAKSLRGLVVVGGAIILTNYFLL